jgi:1-phosphatidylinositol-4-phosphate 5-kinase
LLYFIFNIDSNDDINLNNDAKKGFCAFFGFVFQFSLVGANLWYSLLAFDLMRAIRNPFGITSQHGWKHHLFIWSVCILTLILLALSFIDLNGVSTGSGISIFYFCWISIRTDVTSFVGWSAVLYFIPHFMLWIGSLIINVFALCILLGKFPASSETRKHVLKQNALYIIILGMETIIIIPLWIAQMSITAVYYGGRFCFMDTSSLALSFIFAIVHSLRGTIDLVVWWCTFCIGYNDFKDLWLRCKARRYRNLYLPQESLHTPLITSQESRVNTILRKDVIYCINYAILDATKLNSEEETQRTHLGSVRDPFMAQIMVKYDEEVHQKEEKERHADPHYQEVRRRKIPFHPSPSNSLRHFAFIDIEPTLFGLLRSSYGISSSTYQQSFKIGDDQDVESSGMLEKFTEGKSGSFFYFTRDYRYIIKTITPQEEAFLQKIAYRYYDYMHKNPDSIIVRLYGLHKVRLAREQKYISVVVMDNLFYNDHNLKMTERYDLKGSTIGRQVLKGNESPSERYKKTLKDMDLRSKIFIGEDAKTQLMEQLQRDVEFLSSLHIMDYSLLLGIHNHQGDGIQLQKSMPLECEGGDDFTQVLFNRRDSEGNMQTFGSSPGTLGGMGTLERGAALAQRHNTFISLYGDNLEDSMLSQASEISQYIQWHRRDFGGLRSHSPHHPLNMQRFSGGSLSVAIPYEDIEDFSEKNVPTNTYYFGIVDILQEYNFEKKLENFTKTRVLCKDREGISAIDEKRYAKRFVNAMENIFV